MQPAFHLAALDTRGQLLAQRHFQEAQLLGRPERDVQKAGIDAFQFQMDRRIAYGAVADGIAGHAMDHDGGFIRGSA